MRTFGPYTFAYDEVLGILAEENYKRIAIQVPEGLIAFVYDFVRDLERESGIEAMVFCDAIYGACCIEDDIASRMRLDAIFHFGHDRLIKTEKHMIPNYYYSTRREIDGTKLINSVIQYFKQGTILHVICTTQFRSNVYEAYTAWEEAGLVIDRPNCGMLPEGVVLGCTAPKLKNIDAVLYVGDGRFHPEAMLLQNPGITLYKYDPLAPEPEVRLFEYNALEIVNRRQLSMNRIAGMQRVVVLEGILGKQGDSKLTRRVLEEFKMQNIETTVIFVSLIKENYLQTLARFYDGICVIACPRLPIDWELDFNCSIPLFLPQEVFLHKKSCTECVPLRNYGKSTDPWDTMQVEDF
ncbi:hypothetical protein PCE1_002953 [Barthelona sp. PCE]